MKMMFAALSFLFASSAIAAGPTTVPIAVTINGQTFAGEVSAEQPKAAPAGLPAAAVVDDGVVDVPAGPVPLAVHLDAADAIDPTNLRQTRVTWDFGDPSAPRDALVGFNASHAYDRPGTYTVTRRVETPAGARERKYRVVAEEDRRRPIHVSLDGNDALDGATPERAVRSVARAAALLRANSAILLRRGDRFPIVATIDAKFEDVRVGDYGEGAMPVLALAAATNNMPAIRARGARVVVERVAFDSDVSKDAGKDATMEAVNAGGRGLLVRGCVFRAVLFGINGNGVPDGVLLQNCDAPGETSVRAYFAWVQGTDWTILDNAVANSTREHVVRVGGGERINVTGNRFANTDRRAPDRGGDASDYSKSTLNIQKGRIAYVAQNVLRDGAVSVGPLGQADGLKDKSARWIGAVFEDNRLVRCAAEVQHGAVGVTLRNNVVDYDGGPAFSIKDYAADYDRGCDDVSLERNTAINRGTAGAFARVGGGATRVRIVGNLYIAPNLVVGSYETAVVNARDAAASCLAELSGNRWPEPAKRVGGAAGPFVLAGQYVDAAAWSAAATNDKVIATAPLLATAAEPKQVDGAGADASRVPNP